jgi:hypothetical protein
MTMITPITHGVAITLYLMSLILFLAIGLTNILESDIEKKVYSSDEEK